MDPLLCFPADPPAEVTLALQNAGLGHQGVTGPDEVTASGPDGRITGYSGALVVSGDDMSAAIAFCRHLRLREVPMRSRKPDIAISRSRRSAVSSLARISSSCAPR